jgi:hypothetical protein
VKGSFGSQNKSYCFLEIFKRLIFIMEILWLFLEEESAFEILVRSASLYKSLNDFNFIPRSLYGVPISYFGFIFGKVCIFLLPAGESSWLYECSCHFSLTASGRADHLPHDLLFLGLYVYLLVLSGSGVLKKRLFSVIRWFSLCVYSFSRKHTHICPSTHRTATETM